MASKFFKIPISVKLESEQDSTSAGSLSSAHLTLLLTLFASAGPALTAVCFGVAVAPLWHTLGGNRKELRGSGVVLVRLLGLRGWLEQIG